jgi:hypothetical protein
MKRCGFTLFLVLLNSFYVYADYIVTFNEIMYHPSGNEDEYEWIEIYNQLAVDVDLSGWVITNGIYYKFPEGTIINGRSYLVIAKNPASIMRDYSITNVIGPFQGKLANEGETLELRNNNNRLIDKIQYGNDGDWVPSPNGTGVSLAKIAPDTFSNDPKNWVASAEMGGTPGKQNFPDSEIIIITNEVADINSSWKYFEGEPPAGWNNVNYDDSNWGFGNSLFGTNINPDGIEERIPTLFSTGFNSKGEAVYPGLPDENYFITVSAYSTPPPPPILATVTANHPNWLANDFDSRWIGPVAQGTTSVPQGNYSYRTSFDLMGFDPNSAKITFRVAVDNDLTDVLLNGKSLGIKYSGFTAYSSYFTLTNGFQNGTNTLEFLTSNSGTSPSPAGLKVNISGTAKRILSISSQLNPNVEPKFFRKTFLFNGSPSDSKIYIRHMIDDGAVIYLNGSEIYRINMPSGIPSSSTFALTNVLNPGLSDWIEINGNNLLNGTNVIAVRVHQAIDDTNNCLFAMQMRIITTNYPYKPNYPIAFNEISSVTNGQFWVELINYGEEPISLNGFTLARFGNNSYREYVIPDISIPTGGFFVIDKSVTGFGADPGDMIVLYSPGKTSVVDSLITKKYPRARYPDGKGKWLIPFSLTPGNSNYFVFNDSIVINEIMYHAPDLPYQPAQYLTNKLISFTNYWKYNQLGVLPSGDWYLPGYDDSAWDTGKAAFSANISSLPVPRGTTLVISNGMQPIISYYFRTKFVFTNIPDGSVLSMYFVVDDGAVFYLNGKEIYRYGMQDGQIDDSTLAITNIGVPTIVGPITISGKDLVVGTNVIAAEVHQYFPPPRSKDVAFALELTSVELVSPELPVRESTESWIELYNKGSAPVDLTGWKLSGSASYSFENGTTIPPNGYLVVAYDVNLMRAKYPDINIVGPMKKHLSKKSGTIVLEDNLGNPVDKVTYYDRFPFSEYADGFGSSLELTDPRADNSVPEVWMASDESGKSDWVTIRYRGIATQEPANSPTLWKEFVMGLLDAGEVWIDDVSVIESPNGNRRELIQNGNFENGLYKWRVLGSHRHSEVIAEPGNPSNHILRIVANAPTEHIHNHIETTLAYGASITNGMEYEISFRAKWVGGCNKLNTRLYFNRLPRTTELPIPNKYGTPGKRNTAYTSNAGPTFTQLEHTPVVPSPGESVRVSVRISDPDGIKVAKLAYAVNEGVWTLITMSVIPDGNGVVANAVIPKQSAGSIVQFYILATDSLEKYSTYPSGGINSRALYRVSDGQYMNPKLHNIRIIMTPSDAELLHTATNKMSNELLGCTVIVDNKRVYYNAGVHLQGSERNRVGFTVRLPAGKELWGVYNGFTIDRSGGQSGLGGKHDEILIWRVINKAGGLPDIYDDLCQVIAPRSTEDGTGFLRIAKYGDVFLDSAFKNGSDGEMYKLELIYYPTNTVDGNPESIKLPNPDLVLGTDIKDLGDDKENYRWTFLKENHVARDNYAPIISLAKTFSFTGTNLEFKTEQVMDVDEWLRAVALLSLIGSDDMYTYNNSHNLIIYFRPEDGRGMAFLWDLDYSFVASITKAFPGSGSPNTYKIITTIPNNYRRYYHHLYDLTELTGNSAFLTDWANRYAGLLGQNWSGVVNYLVQRANFVRSQLPLSTSFTVKTPPGGFSVSSDKIVLSGTAPISVQNIEINGLKYNPYWTDFTTWNVTVPLPAFTNFITIKALDSKGNVISNGVASIVITNTAQKPLLPVIINEWMAYNSGPGGYPDPVDGLFQDWFELYNPNDTSVDLSGYYLTDNQSLPNKFTIPANTVIQSHGFLLVWADGEEQQNLAANPNQIHANFKLSKAGGMIAIFAPDGSLVHSVVYTSQVQNVSQGFFPDGNTNMIYSMPDWTPARPNKISNPLPPVIDIKLSDSNSVLLKINCAPYRTYCIEYSEKLGYEWRPLITNRTENGIIEYKDSINLAPIRFYRAFLLP